MSDHEDMSTWTDESFEAEIGSLRTELASLREAARKMLDCINDAGAMGVAYPHGERVRAFIKSREEIIALPSVKALLEEKQ